MKNLQSISEGTWVELLPVTLTEEQKTLLNSNNVKDKSKIDELFKYIKSQREVALALEDEAIAESIYTANKPVLEEGETYELISVNMTLTEGSASGIINFRINGEHKQIRF